LGQRRGVCYQLARLEAKEKVEVRVDKEVAKRGSKWCVSRAERRILLVLHDLLDEDNLMTTRKWCGMPSPGFSVR
jgi:hypothetical protein